MNISAWYYDSPALNGLMPTEEEVSSPSSYHLSCHTPISQHAYHRLLVHSHSCSYANKQIIMFGLALTFHAARWCSTEKCGIQQSGLYNLSLSSLKLIKRYRPSVLSLCTVSFDASWIHLLVIFLVEINNVDIANRPNHNNLSYSLGLFTKVQPLRHLRCKTILVFGPSCIQHNSIALILNAQKQSNTELPY